MRGPSCLCWWSFILLRISLRGVVRRHCLIDCAFPEIFRRRRSPAPTPTPTDAGARRRGAHPNPTPCVATPPTPTPGVATPTDAHLFLLIWLISGTPLQLFSFCVAPFRRYSPQNFPLLCGSGLGRPVFLRSFGAARLKRLLDMVFC